MRKISVKIRWIFGKKGSALLTALLVMGVLLSVSLALSALVLREIYTTKEVLDAGRAYYGAESGIEVSLYKIKHNLPGWETPEEASVPLKIDNDQNVVAEYKVDNTCNAYPCFGDADFDKKNADLTAFYDVLDLNESITIPLFVVVNGVEHKVKDFTVEFYGVFNPKTDLKIKGTNGITLSGWDILRWKILGISEGKQNNTESISDFTALSEVAVGEGVGANKSETDAKDPSWFGSVRCSAKEDGERYTGAITCTPYGGTYEEAHLGTDVAATVVGSCANTEAREHYVYDLIGDVKMEDCYPISEFLGTHKLNYLTLTNLMNPSVLRDELSSDQKTAMSKLYFRIELFGEDGVVLNEEAGSADVVYDNKTVREYAEIVSNGYSGDSKQSISVNLKRDSFMPVFNFSLYSTYKNEGNMKNDPWNPK